MTQMAVQVGHAISADSTLSPPAKYHWFRDGEENNAQTFDLGDPAPALLLQYGYTDARQNLFYQTTGLFSAAALLLAFGIAVSSRRERWSLFWCAQIVLPYLIWSGWLALVTGQDGLSMIRLACGREGLIGALPAVAKLCLAPFALQFISSLIAFPVYRQLRGVEITWLQASHAALWRSALPAPIAALLLLATDRQTIMIPAIVIFGAVVCALFQFWFLHNLFRALRIGGSKVAEGELRDRVFALADQAKIKLVRFCVIPEGAWKSVHSMTTGDRSLLLAQPIIDRLSRPEVDAIVAHELAHLHLKHRSKAILLLLAAAFLVFTIESQIPREQGLAVLLVLMAGLLAAVVLVNAFRRQADYVGGIV